MILAHRIFGHGARKVIVLHGWFADHSVFEPMFGALDGDAFTYAFVDYRGYGASRHLTGEYTIDEIAGDALALADHLAWPRFHLVGHSMGGMVSQRVTVREPSRVISSVALTPVPAMGGPRDAESLQLFAGATDDDALRRGILDFSTGQRLGAAWLSWMVRRSHETTSRGAFDGYRRAFTLGDFSAEADGLVNPILVAVGEHDQALTADVMRHTYLEINRNAELVTIANSGHYPMCEAPVWTAWLVQDFLSRTTG